MERGQIIESGTHGKWWRSPRRHHLPAFENKLLIHELGESCQNWQVSE
ncbi:MAG: hypothetical protein HC840_16515 [Leptolyngbyaceae cyanobacterium RM2_2_4]|nr:hypothetical protein [bacterium]NJO50780.1 hypothetical protein [Leptolyngbyaceae cyanobacterium RM2_2_4]